MDKKLHKRQEQRVELQGGSSPWRTPPADVPQGSCLSPLLFSIHVNDLSDVLPMNADCNLFADDTTLSTSNKSVKNIQETLQLAVDNANLWFKTSKVKANPMKTEIILLQTDRQKKRKH